MVDTATGTSPAGNASPGESITGVLEAAAVGAGWQLVDAYERLGAAKSARAFATDLDREFAHARVTVQDLLPWRGLGPKARAVYESDRNRLRFRRVLDLVRPGDRVFDIGLGRGYLCGLLLRDGGVASYAGIDIVETNLQATRSMIDANGLQADLVDVSLGDLYDLTIEQVGRSGTSLVICCEVLEHVADPEWAMIVLADALPEDAELLVSVPLLGRLDSVWGHCTMFDASRIKAMVEAAGLRIHHVEPLANTWTLLLLSRRSVVSDRALSAAVRRPSATYPRQIVRRDWRKIDPAAEFTVAGAAPVAVEPRRSGIVCTVGGPTARRLAFRSVRGGLAYPVRGLYGLRLELGFGDLSNVRRIFVDGYAGSERVARWTWAPARRRVLEPKQTFLLRPGQSTAYFVSAGFTDVERADRIEILGAIDAGKTASFEIRRLAYLA
jgi:SAM-dependent methyltransferase